ncbi:hypothetical protein KY284_030281 [Solanum tuberosum]|nr:hypothetical protein KY284_030281 [Solanum tuberosum]
MEELQLFLSVCSTTNKNKHRLSIPPQPLVLSQISVLGSAFLALLAVGPAVIEQATHLTAFRGFAGTSVLILVGCATDTAWQGG